MAAMSNSCSVAIIGAGPYGLSIAAHLRARGIEFRIFGTPMNTWRTRMPAGMFLKSEAFASNLSDPQRGYTLKRFCTENGIEYGDSTDKGPPVSLETFTAYGLWFQKQLVPDVEDRAVVGLEQSAKGFLLRLDDGDTVTARRVIVAIGTTYFAYVPESLSHLPSDLLSHASEHHDLSRFRGRDVSVLGGGASALDLAALLHGVGATVRLIARQSSLSWSTKIYRPPWRRWYPLCGLGGGGKSILRGAKKRFCEHAPMLFRHLPTQARVQINLTLLPPSGAWPIRQCVEQLPLLLGHVLKRAEARDTSVHLRLIAPDGAEREVWTDHLIAATGYRLDLRKLTFLNEPLRLRLRSIGSAPILSANFESSIPSLFFVGLASANTFGPVMRHTLGARYTARRLSWHLARSTASEAAPAMDESIPVAAE